MHARTSAMPMWAAVTSSCSATRAAPLAVVGAHDPGERSVRREGLRPTSWSGVKGLADKPEGLVVLPDGDVLIACDMRASRSARTLFLVAGSDCWNPSGGSVPTGRSGPRAAPRWVGL